MANYLIASCQRFQGGAHRQRGKWVAVSALAALSMLLAACDGATATPKASDTPAIQRPAVTPTPVLQPVIEVTYQVTPEIEAGAQATLIFGITNVGDVRINDLDLAIDAVFMSNFAPGTTIPRARIGELPLRLHFLYGGLEPGESQELLIRLFPINLGEFPMRLEIIDLGRAGLALVDPDGNPWVVEETITVVPPPQG